MAKRKRTKHDLQNITQTTKYRLTRTPPKYGRRVNSCVMEGLAVPAPHATPIMLPLNGTNII